MPASSESSLSLPSPIARGVGLAGVVLIVLFLTILSASLMPVRVLDPAWQLRVGGVLINASPFPLIGLVLLHVAASLCNANTARPWPAAASYAVPPSS